jgi:two-component system response regulator YesN
MYRILIIDDEPVVREGISQTIDWAALGYELVGACRDGREGLEALETHSPDVVLTDICMPFVDGLELAAWIGERYPTTRTILLTGYDEFEYAHEAVKLRVSDFILKPITAAELSDRLAAVRRELDQERDQRERAARVYEQLKESLPVLRERFLNRLVRNAIDPDEFAHKTEILELEIPGPAYIVLVCDRDGSDGDDELTVFAIQRLIESTLAEHRGAVSFSTSSDESVIIVSDEDIDTALSRGLRCAERVSEVIGTQLGNTVSIGVGMAVDSISALPESFRDARTALEHRLVLGENHIITVDQVRGGSETPRAADNSGARARFIQALKTGEVGESREAIDEIVGDLRRTGAGTDACSVALQRLLAEALNALESLGLEYERVPGLESNPFTALDGLKTLDGMRSWFLEMSENARQLLDERRVRHSRYKAVEAEELIKERYAESDLSLTGVCSALSVSKSYLSPVFKAHTGMTFVEYLTHVRMERARELLTTGDFKTYEVAARVGFRDAHYFSLTFRKQTGLSPTEFREHAMGGVG